MSITPELPVIDWEDLGPDHWDLLDTLYMAGVDYSAEFIRERRKPRDSWRLRQLEHVGLIVKILDDSGNFKLTTEGLAIARYRFGERKAIAIQRYRDSLTNSR